MAQLPKTKEEEEEAEESHFFSFKEDKQRPV